MEQKIYSSLATEILRNSKPTGSCFIVELVVRMANGMLFLQLGRVLKSQPSPKTHGSQVANVQSIGEQTPVVSHLYTTHSKYWDYTLLFPKESTCIKVISLMPLQL